MIGMTVSTGKNGMKNATPRDNTKRKAAQKKQAKEADRTRRELSSVEAALVDALDAENAFRSAQIARYSAEVIWPVWLESSSIACLPIMKTLGSSF